MSQKIRRLLIANRGEIACRIIKTAKKMGIVTLAVYSEADAGALHTQLADEAIAIGPAAASASYLNIDVLVQAALKHGADAVHPGYGFLSENADFAQALIDKNITFIGPSPTAIRTMGDKRLAKNIMIEAGVPVLPGYSGSDQSDAQFIAQAAQIGYPVMVKAAHGGGGRGMRLVTTAEALPDAVASARSEAQNAFGNGELLLEKALLQPRHIEVQIFADSHQRCVHIGERDCSIQRRHQKIVEEAPAIGLNDDLREALGSAAVKAALAADYRGAGTVEFLVQDDGFYFLEMNTRLQVEHPVTEQVFGVDLVAWQIAVAEGAALPKTQSELYPHGHAIEVRLYAEDPAQNFLPQTGQLQHWHSPIEEARVDHWLSNGATIGNWYDPLLAKIIVWGEDRAQALQRLQAQLSDTALLGINHNLGFLRRIAKHETFLASQPDTGFLNRYALAEAPAQETQVALMMAAIARFLTQTTSATWPLGLSHLSHPKQQYWQLGDHSYTLTVDARQWAQQQLRIRTAAGDECIATDIQLDRQQLQVRLNGCRYQAFVAVSEQAVWVQFAGDHRRVEWTSALQHNSAAGSDSHHKAPMNGLVVAVRAENNSQVNAGDTLLIIEAMKMELPIKAQCSGQVTLLCAVGDQVAQGNPLVHIDTSACENATH